MNAPEVMVDQEVTDEMIDDILTTALEGGVNYWSGRHVVRVPEWPPDSVTSRYDIGGTPYASEIVSHGYVIEIPEQGDEAEVIAWHRLNRYKMVRGIKLAANHYRKSLEGLHEDHDADSADVAVQFALFGEIVYG